MVHVVDAGHRIDHALQRGVVGHIRDPLAGDPDLAAVTKAFAIIVTGQEGHRLGRSRLRVDRLWTVYVFVRYRIVNARNAAPEGERGASRARSQVFARILGGTGRQIGSSAVFFTSSITV